MSYFLSYLNFILHNQDLYFSFVFIFISHFYLSIYFYFPRTEGIFIHLFQYLLFYYYMYSSPITGTTHLIHAITNSRDTQRKRGAAIRQNTMSGRVDLVGSFKELGTGNHCSW